MWRCSDYICELIEERAMLERILGSSSKRDRVEKEQKRAKLAELLEGIKQSQAEVLAELELLRKDDAKASLAHIWLAVWRSGSVVRRLNEVTLR